jgi:hypothetical protein
MKNAIISMHELQIEESTVNSRSPSTSREYGKLRCLTPLRGIGVQRDLSRKEAIDPSSQIKIAFEAAGLKLMASGRMVC